jgi:hypothetical protein
MNGFEFMTVAVIWGMGAGAGALGLGIAAVTTVCLGTLRYAMATNDYFEDDDFIDLESCFLEDETAQLSIGPVFPEGEVLEGQVHFLQEEDYVKVFEFEIDHDGDVGSWVYLSSIAYTGDDKPDVIATPITE